MAVLLVAFVIRSNFKTRAAVAVDYQLGEGLSGDDTFAQCLTDNGAVMYGASWCGHCANQKEMFGDSFQYVDYVECTENTEVCNAAGVQGYPTWIISGKQYAGEQRLEKLAEITGCRLG